jgi:hypothetical protein
MLKRRRARAIGVLGLGVAAAVGLWLVFSAQISAPATIVDPPPGPGPSLDTILAEHFSDLELTAVATDAVPISRVEAEAALTVERPALHKVLEATLVHVDSFFGCHECNLWLFSMDVGRLSNVKFEVVAVDADTGKYVGAIGGCGQTPNCP